MDEYMVVLPEAHPLCVKEKIEIENLENEPFMLSEHGGKTAFTRGLARGLGIPMRVTSPTYTIVNEYLSGRMPLFHFDMYRLDSADDLFDIGWEDYLARGGVCAVEWSENVEEALSGAIRITIHKDPADENVRTITIEGGERFADLGV